MNRIDELFARTRREGRLAVLPYLTAGFPARSSTVALVEAMVTAGADGLELGVPFSDPIADGVAIQHSTYVALRHGMSVGESLRILRDARRAVQVPILVMGYFNPFLQYGIERLCDEAAASGADGFIVPDLPLEEADDFKEHAQARGIHLILFVAPTSTEERLKRVGELASGFVYCVALRGVTGARAQLAEDIDTYLARVRRHTAIPIVVGFGISKPEHIAHLRGKAEGAIVASAIVDLLEATPIDQRPAVLSAYIASLVAAEA